MALLSNKANGRQKVALSSPCVTGWGCPLTPRYPPQTSVLWEDGTLTTQPNLTTCHLTQYGLVSGKRRSIAGNRKVMTNWVNPRQLQYQFDINEILSLENEKVKIRVSALSLPTPDTIFQLVNISNFQSTSLSPWRHQSLVWAHLINNNLLNILSYMFQALFKW